MDNNAIETNVTEVAKDILKEEVTMTNGTNEQDIAVSTLVNEIANGGADEIAKSNGVNPIILIGLGIIGGVAGKIVFDKIVAKKKTKLLEDGYEPCEIDEDEYDVEEAEDE